MLVRATLPQILFFCNGHSGSGLSNPAYASVGTCGFFCLDPPCPVETCPNFSTAACRNWLETGPSCPAGSAYFRCRKFPQKFVTRSWVFDHLFDLGKSSSQILNGAVWCSWRCVPLSISRCERGAEGWTLGVNNTGMAQPPSKRSHDKHVHKLDHFLHETWQRRTRLEDRDQNLILPG